MNAYLVTAVLPAGKAHADLQNVLDLYEDWFRFQPGCWIVVSSTLVDEMSREMKDFTKPTGAVLVAPIELTDLRGWMTEDFWKWVAARRAG